MLLSRSPHPPGPSVGGAGDGPDKLPQLESFLEKRDFLGALTLLEFQRCSGGKELGSLIAYTLFHLGDFHRALEEYKGLLAEHQGSSSSSASSASSSASSLDEGALWLNAACCLFNLGMYGEGLECAVKGGACALKTRLLFHLSHKLGDEEGVSTHHAQMEELLHNQLSLASMHYLRQDYQSSIDIYKRLLLDNSLFEEEVPLPHLSNNLIQLIASSHSPTEVLFLQRALHIPREFVALNVYVALCYHRLEYFDVSQEVLALYLQSFPGSTIALNLRACNTFRLYNGVAAEKELKPLLNIMNQEEVGGGSSSFHLIRHNLVVFRGGEGALQVLPKLVDLIPEARFNLIIYHLHQEDLANAARLTKGLKLKGTPEKILFAIVNLLLSYSSSSESSSSSGTAHRENLQSAQNAFNQVGGEEHDSVFGRLCMASAHFIAKNFDHAALYLNSVRSHYYNDDTFNFNYAQTQGMLNEWAEVEELLTMIQNSKIRSQFTYIQWLARAYIMNKKPRLAWELHERMDTSPQSFRLLGLIGTECYRLGQFYYAAKAFDLLEKYEASVEHWEGKRGAIVGVFQLIIAGEEPRESLHEMVALLRNSPRPNAEKILGVIKKWARDNRLNL